MERDRVDAGGIRTCGAVDVGCRRGVLLLLALLAAFEVYGKPYSQRARVRRVGETTFVSQAPLHCELNCSLTRGAADVNIDFRAYNCALQSYRPLNAVYQGSI